MKRNIYALLMAVALSVSLLAGCSSQASADHLSEKVEDTQSVSTNQSSQSAQDAVEPTDTEKIATSDSPAINDASESKSPTPTVIAISTTGSLPATVTTFSLDDVPAFSGAAYVTVNGNIPYFDLASLSAESSESYSPLDSLGRCGVAYACIGQDIMPTEERGSIGMVKPTGWHTVKYDCVDGKYLYNRCHLIGYQLSGENANTSNLITGTRYLNIDGMLSFENMTADYVKETGNHVAYRVTPIFEGDNLLAAGVLMEGYSVEDQGDGICFCVFAYNVQPGVEIDYATGDSWLTDSGTAVQISSATTQTASTPAADTAAAPAEATTTEEETKGQTYVLNTNTKKFHYPSCSSVTDMKEKNKKEYTGSRDDLISQGYTACKRCNP